MKLAFDHLVHLVNRPEAAVEAFKKVGLQCRLGGRHEKWGTYNSLSYYGLSYIEFLGIFDQNLASRVTENDLVVQTVKRLPNQEGFARMALRTHDIHEVARNLKLKDIDIIGPIKAHRKREDGKILHWQMLFINETMNELPFPFIIQWEEDDSSRLKDINQSGSNDQKLKELVFMLKDHVTTAEKWSQLFQLQKSDPYIDETLQTNSINLQIDGCDIVFASPRDGSKISGVMNEKGEGPFLLRIKHPTVKVEKEILGGYYQFV